MADGWDQKEGSLLCFTLMGEEHVDALLFSPETYSQMLALFGIARSQRFKVVRPTTSEGMLGCGGLGEIKVSQDKRPVCPGPTEPPEM